MPVFDTEVVVEVVLRKEIEADTHQDAVKIAKDTAHKAITWAEPSEQCWDAGEMLELDEERIITEELTPERLVYRGRL